MDNFASAFIQLIGVATIVLLAIPAVIDCCKTIMFKITSSEEEFSQRKLRY